MALAIPDFVKTIGNRLHLRGILKQTSVQWPSRLADVQAMDVGDVADLLRATPIEGTRRRITDKEVVSMLAMYGLQSRNACSPTTTLVPIYAAAWMHLEIFEETLRSKQCDFGAYPRLTATTRWLQFWPSRICPKSVVNQIKEDGKEKDRAVTDAGARRARPAASDTTSCSFKSAVRADGGPGILVESLNHRYR